jgi:hypothetical protein
MSKSRIGFTCACGVDVVLRIEPKYPGYSKGVLEYTFNHLDYSKSLTDGDGDTSVERILKGVLVQYEKIFARGAACGYPENPRVYSW